jgi:hypothetical protein
MAIAEKKLEIQARTFLRSSPAADNSNLSRFISFAASEVLIRETAELCKVSLLQLGVLLGIYDPHHIYQWTTLRKRPSPVYLSRLHKLALIEAKFPSQVFWMRSINWTTGHIFWKDGYLPPEDMWDRSQLTAQPKLEQEIA